MDAHILTDTPAAGAGNGTSTGSGSARNAGTSFPAPSGPGPAMPEIPGSPDVFFLPHELPAFLTTSSATRDTPLSRHFKFLGTTWRTVMLSESCAKDAETSGCRRLPVRTILASLNSGCSRVMLKARALALWMEGALYCGACGTALEDAQGPDSGGRQCPGCKRLHFPRISPAVIVLITRGDTILLARNARFPGKRFSLIAGFVEAGETLEETIAREVREEAGIEVDSMVYRNSQPWPFPDSLMLGFTARWVSGEARPDGEEIVELGWFDRDSLPEIPPPGSIAHNLIMEYLKNHP